jgi:hypothetical protein
LSWPEVTFLYPPEVEAAYYAGTLFRQWFDKYPPLTPERPDGHYLFRDRMIFRKKGKLGRDMPHSGPVKAPCFFREFYTAMQYLDAGYEAMVYHRKVEDPVCFEKACELFGGNEAGESIVPNWERKGRCPDLIIFKPGRKLFRFVECKGQKESFTKPQVARFEEIESQLFTEYLGKEARALHDPAYPQLFPPLPPGKWTHIARVVEEPGHSKTPQTNRSRPKQPF